MADSPAPEPNDDEPVPRLPRGRGLKFSGPEMFRIAITLSLLVAIVMLARPCANAVSHFVMGFGSGSAAGSATPKPDNARPPEPEYEHLTPDMTDAERKAAIDRAKARAKASKEAGSAEPARPAPTDSGGAPSAIVGSGATR